MRVRGRAGMERAPEAALDSGSRRMSSGHGRPRPTGGAAAWVAVALAAVAPVGCQSSNPWVTGTAGRADDRQIQVVALDFVTDHYVRRLRSRDPTVYCVGLRPAGRIQSGPDLLEVSERSDRWDPGQSVIRALQEGQRREVRPLSECSWDPQAREIHRESGTAAISFVAGPVRFETPGLALVTIEARESGYAGGRFGCRVERRGVAWSVDTCV